MAYCIYMADDEENIRNIVKAFLTKEGYLIRTFENGDLLYDAFCAVPCDLVILDIMMPGSSGLAICRKLRQDSNVPIILLTAKDTDDDYITGITLGSDDYIIKPFRPTILIMRVKAILRREALGKAGSAEEDLSAGDLILSEKKHTISANAVMLDLTPTEYAVLRFLLLHKEEAVSRDEMLNEIWGYADTVETRVTDETVRKIRKKLREAGSTQMIRNVWGYGYRLENTV